MTTSSLSSEIIRNLGFLKKEEKSQVLIYIKSLINRKRGGKAGLLNLAGSIPLKEAQQMIMIIENGCENIDPNEWQ